MKKVVLVSILVALGLNVFTACATMQTTDNSLKQQVNEKITKMQKFVKFDNKQAKKLKKLELYNLQKMNEIQNCENCNKEELLKTLQEEKTKKLQQILLRHQYIKYDAIENKRIKKGTLIAE